MSRTYHITKLSFQITDEPKPTVIPLHIPNTILPILKAYEKEGKKIPNKERFQEPVRHRPHPFALNPTLTPGQTL
ncbi:hypothetical protein JTE90_019306 [Oedothorax gibbosus]|uniref:Uncharacterized protein n=1 Tax=Oedothorax gibbosus TaxID=931172 RepID=A0AAV6UY20_9ARAC|nr:hypothetical protein JTE90_019306 [Oedothorax gibbosus]